MRGPVLVTGGAGSIGRRVVARLLKMGRTVRVFDLPSVDYAGLEADSGVEIHRGSLTDLESVKRATHQVGAAIHLGALLPPVSERDRERTFAVNVAGTRALALALCGGDPPVPFVFSSTVGTFGDTSGEQGPVSVDHPLGALDIYAESKIAAERALRELCGHAVILRVSGVAVPGFHEPPSPWPFAAEQRIEFVHRDDVVAALTNAVDSEAARGRELIIAGGPSWRTTGQRYVEDYFNLLGVPLAEAQFLAQPGYFDHYNTVESQRILRYQRNSYQDFVHQTKRELLRLMGE
jgi:nucleoside-diphosphate-sugar epimerase